MTNHLPTSQQVDILQGMQFLARPSILPMARVSALQVSIFPAPIIRIRSSFSRHLDVSQLDIDSLLP